MGSFPFLGVAARQAQVLEQTAHRPWPPPEEPWAQAQTRLDVLFAHWRVGLDELARLLPPGLPLDTYDGDAWLGLVRFRLASLRLRGLPPLPGVTFEQLDIRTYVTPRRPAGRLAVLGRRVEPGPARGRQARPPPAGVPRADDLRA